VLFIASVSVDTPRVHESERVKLVPVGAGITRVLIYFGFMGLFAFDKPLLGTILIPGLSLCIVLGPLVIISSFLLCLIYVLWANRVYDAGVRDLR